METENSQNFSLSDKTWRCGCKTENKIDDNLVEVPFLQKDEIPPQVLREQSRTLMSYPIVKIFFLIMVGLILINWIASNRNSENIAREGAEPTESSESVLRRIYTTQSFTRSELETIAEIDLPESVTELESHVERGMDEFVALKFQLPDSELADFLSKAGYSQPLESLNDGYYIRSYFYLSEEITNWPSKEEWDSLVSDKSVTLMRGSQQEPGFSRNIIVDQTNPEQYTVYLVHFGL